MPKRPSIDFLPSNLKKELDRRLVENRFSQYRELANWLQSEGYSICRTSVAVYSQKFKKYLEKIETAVLQAKTIIEVTGDDSNALAEALGQIVQHRLFEAISAEDLDNRSLTSLAMAAARINSSSATIKAFKQKASLRAQQATEEVRKEQTSGGLSQETADRIIQQIWGVVCD